MIKKAYIRGFMRKCAERRVNPKTLLKLAAEDVGDLKPYREDVEALEGGSQTPEVADPVQYPSYVYTDPKEEARWAAREAKRQKAMVNYANTVLPQDIHAPVTAADVGNAITNFPEYSKSSQLPAVPMAGNMILQRFVDAMQDPGPQVRNPTPYELAEFYRSIFDSAARGGKDWSGVQSRLTEAFGPVISLMGGKKDSEGTFDSLASKMVPSLLAADPKLQNEAIRRGWNAATSAVPQKVTSPTR